MKDTKEAFRKFRQEEMRISTSTEEIFNAGYQAALAAVPAQEPVTDEEVARLQSFVMNRIAELDAQEPVKQERKPIPLNEIGGILNEVMDNAVRNGANSISMPDEYVAVAHFLCYPEEYCSVKQESKFVLICNLWVDENQNYVVDRCDHPPHECIAAYAQVPTTPVEVKE